MKVHVKTSKIEINIELDQSDTVSRAVSLLEQFDKLINNTQEVLCKSTLRNENEPALDNSSQQEVSSSALLNKVKDLYFNGPGIKDCCYGKCPNCGKDGECFRGFCKICLLSENT